MRNWQQQYDAESEDYDPEAAITAVKAYAATVADDAEVTYVVQDEETMAEEDETANGADLKAAVEVYEKWNATAPDNADYGIWIPGIPAFLESALDAANCADWLKRSDPGWYRSRCRRCTWFRSTDA